jgi:hypothetical protein
MNNNKLSPEWNGFQYLFVFIVGFVGDLIIHLLASKKILAMSLLPYYKSLSISTPFPKWFNIWIFGGILGGIACIIALLGSDIILQTIVSAKGDM